MLSDVVELVDLVHVVDLFDVVDFEVQGNRRYGSVHSIVTVINHWTTRDPLEEIGTPQAKTLCVQPPGRKMVDMQCQLCRLCTFIALQWCLLFVLIRQGLKGGSGPQRLARALGIETGNQITRADHFFPLICAALHNFVRLKNFCHGA